MIIAINGAGEIGRHFAAELSTRGHDVRIIEQDLPLSRELNERLDAKVIHGDGSTVETLVTVDPHECDLFLSLSGNDTTNLVAASVAKSLGAERVVARVRPSRYAEQWLLSYRDHFNIDHLFCPEQLTAVELAKYVRNPNRVAVEELCNGRIELQQGQVSADSSMIGQPLSTLNLPERVRIAFIQRDGKSFVPEAGDSLRATDIVTLFGAPAKLPEALRDIQATPETAPNDNIVILGGGAHGAALAQRLQGAKRRIRIMERDSIECERLANRLTRCVILNVNATSMRELREEQVGKADYFIAVTGQDEDNVMLCLQAQTLGARNTIALVERTDFADVISSRKEQLGITAAVSPRSIATRELLRFVTSEKYHEVTTLTGNIDVLGFPIRKDSRLAGRALKDLPRHRGAIFVAVTRRNQVFAPAADDVFIAGDTVYALVTEEARKEFIKRTLR